LKLYSLFNKKVFNIQPGLERIKKACEELGNIQNNFPSILISGTNGKGSTAAFLESLFRHHNLKTGLFTSPHLVEENERWQINRKNISDETLENYIKEIEPLIKKYDLTYFEACTLLAFKYFSEENVDIAVLEVGLGGRWDSTNVVYPEVSIITNVSFDHMHLLGDTLEKIAYEKVGIARTDRPLIIGSNQKEILNEALKKGVKEIYQYEKDFSVKYKDEFVDYKFRNYEYKDLKPSLIGKRQAFNLASALTGFLVYAERKNLNINDESVKKAVSSTAWAARMQILSENPLIILDGAHNYEGIVKTYDEIKELYPDKKIITIFSVMKDKDIAKIIEFVEKNSEKVIFTFAGVSRSIDENDVKGKIFIKDIKDAIDFAKKIQKDNLILITGSLYLSGEVLKIWTQ
jgi:dihydrofolate synthase/folylpolyglutamate synthase